MAADFILQYDGGTIGLVIPQNEVAEEHLRTHVTAEAQWLGDALAVEHRFVYPLCESLIDDGFTVEEG